MFRAMGETYKCEIIAEIPEGEEISLYRHGEFVDVCRGPHVSFAGQVKAVKLTHVAGAYWRGKVDNPMLQRIYGTAFASKDALKAHLDRIEEAKRRDHRKLGRELGLFMFHDWAPGAPFWLPNGTVLYNTLSQVMRALVLGEGYVEVKTPLLFNKALWEKSGHWEKYRDNMFLCEGKRDEDEEKIHHGGTEARREENREEILGLKAMNCPSHMLVFAAELRSYRELPLRLHDQGVLHRNEASGTLGGLTRVRQFQQDDAHIFLPESEIGAEVARLLKLVDRVYATFGMTYSAKLSTRPEKFLGDPGLWDRAEAALAAALDASGKAYELKTGEGAFYGPKIDFDVTDALGRKWQCATIQCDFVQPSRFELKYVGEDGKDHVPVVIHRALYGSFERFIAMLIEHYGGAFPTWLAPVQAVVITVGDRHEPFAREVAARLAESGVRVEVDARPEKLGYKIRQAQLMQVPYMLVIGDKEVEGRLVAPRPRRGDPLAAMPLEGFVAKIADEARIAAVFSGIGGR
jgi:threonyl-tRNA synthetase